MAVIASQADWGICKGCFDYKCFECKINIDKKEELYVNDGENPAVCSRCLEQEDQ